MSDTEALAIAAKLTKAQRDWLLTPGYVDPNTLRALRRKGIKAIGCRGLTSFGLRVRSILLEQKS